MDITIKKSFRRLYKPMYIKAVIELSKLDDSKFFWKGKKIKTTVDLIPVDQSNSDYLVVQPASDEEIEKGQKNRSVGIAYIQELENNNPVHCISEARNLLVRAKSIIPECNELNKEIDNYLEKTK